MEIKTVYLTDGSPYIVFDEESYPTEEYTEIAPPDGIYQPFYFDGKKWIGASEEEYLKDKVIEPILPTENDLLRQTLLALNTQLAALRKDTAEIPLLKAELERLKSAQSSEVEEVETV